MLKDEYIAKGCLKIFGWSYQFRSRQNTNQNTPFVHGDKVVIPGGVLIAGALNTLYFNAPHICWGGLIKGLLHGMSQSVFSTRSGYRSAVPYCHHLPITGSL